MKQFYFFIIILLFSAAARAEDGPKATKAAKVAAQGSFQVQLRNVDAALVQQDSVLVIFDRYDHTGAGVVYQVFYVGTDNSITIPTVAAGKYYVTIQFLGMHHDKIEKVINIKAQKSEQMKMNLQDVESYSREKVVIPAYTPNFSDLAVLKSK